MRELADCFPSAWATQWVWFLHHSRNCKLQQFLVDQVRSLASDLNQILLTVIGTSYTLAQTWLLSGTVEVSLKPRLFYLYKAVLNITTFISIILTQFPNWSSIHRLHQRGKSRPSCWLPLHLRFFPCNHCFLIHLWFNQWNFIPLRHCKQCKDFMNQAYEPQADAAIKDI